MSFRKFIAIVGVAAFVMQPTYSASIGNACICPFIINDPVCGSDGNTYSNDCEFDCAKKLNRNLEMFSRGECIQVQNLPAEDGPIEVHNLPVDGEADACLCTLIYDPLCGSDGQTYSSDCEFNCAKKYNRNLEVHSKGECIQVQNLPAVDGPIEVHNLPADEENDACICQLNYNPLCGSDGNTYSNDCDFNCAKKLNRNLEVYAEGECIEIQNLPAKGEKIQVQNLPANDEVDICVCPFLLDPVCGSDGNTYSNECEISCAKKFNRNLEVFAKGECFQVQNLPAEDSPIEVHNLPADEENNACICPLNYDPLCGSDGNTYSNDCDFNCAKKLNRNLEVYAEGECIEIQNLPAKEVKIQVQNLPANEGVDICVCPFLLDPLCGSDGNTYSNECEINCAKKFNRNLEVHSKGECIQVQNLPGFAR